jgi:hypothetical protein
VVLLVLLCKENKMAYSAIFAGGPTLDPALMQQMQDVYAPLPEQSMMGKASGWLSNPENQLKLMQIGGAIAPEGTFGRNLSTAMSPSLKGQVMKNQTDAEKRKASKIFDQYHADLLAAPHVGGITLKDDGKGGTTSTIMATSQKDMMNAAAMAAQQQAAQIPGAVPAATPAQLPIAPGIEAVEQPAAGVDQPPTKASQIFNPGGGGTAQGPFVQGPGRNTRAGQTTQAWDVKWTPEMEQGFQAWAKDGIAQSGIDPASVSPEVMDQLRKQFLTDAKGLTSQTAGMQPGMQTAPVQAQASAPMAPTPQRAPVRLSQFMGSAPPYTVTGYGLDPQEMLAAQKAGQANALFPVAAAKAQADLEHMQASTEGLQVDTQGKRLGLPGKQTTRIDGALVGLPGIQLDLDSKEMVAVGTKLRELKIKEENVIRMETQATSLAEIRDAQRKLAEVKADEAKAKAQLFSGDPEAPSLVPGLTNKQAKIYNSAGILDNYLNAHATAKAHADTQLAIADRQRDQQLEANVRVYEAGLLNSMSTNSDYMKAKKSGYAGTFEDFVAKKVNAWRRQQAGAMKPIEGATTKVPKYNAATGAFE